MDQSQIEKLAPFEHQALEIPHNTRLLCLHPGSADEPIECSLYPHQLDSDKYHYTALSYVWGNARSLRAISCNGKRFNITRNLFSALIRLRRESKAMLLWVDALCIQQSMEPEAQRERLRQISVMHAIYANAENVIVDIGETDEDTPSLLNDFSLLSRLPPDVWSTPMDQWSNETKALVTIPQLEGRFWASFARFLQRPWLERVWMFQEYVLAKKLGFLLGCDIFSEEYLIKVLISACKMIIQLLNSGPLFNRGDIGILEYVRIYTEAFQMLKFKTSTRSFYKRESPLAMDVAELFHATQWLKATISQDNIYGLLALTSPEVQASFPVDYNESTVQTALRLSILIFEENPLYLLYRGAGLDATLPSWSLILPLRRSLMLAETWEPGKVNTLFHAGKGEVIEAKLNRLDMTIHTKGFLVGTIASKTVVWDPESHNVDEGDISDLFAPFISVSAWIDQHVSEAYPLEVFWRSLVADTVCKNLSVFPSRDFQMFLPSLWAFKRYIFVGNQEEEMQEQSAEVDSPFKDASLFLGCLVMSVRQRLAVLDSGIPCLIPGDALEGDVICVLPGSPLPLTLRVKNDGYAIVGCCFVWGMMQGEAFDKDFPLQDLVIY